LCQDGRRAVVPIQHLAFGVRAIDNARMHITARLADATLKQLLDQLLPVTILLDNEPGIEGRWIKINRTDHLDFVAGQGIRFSTSGELRWSLGPVPVSLTVKELGVLLKPAVKSDGKTTRLHFLPVIEKADFANIPGFIDQGIVGLVNHALEAINHHLAWDFGKALGLQFTLPDTLVPLEAARIEAKDASVEVFDDRIELDVSVVMSVTREPPAPKV
jgi:hypothetical protein